MSSGPTKHWLTPKRLERGPEAAKEELRRWHQRFKEAGFKEGRWVGKSGAAFRRLRTAELARPVDVPDREDVGAAFVEKLPAYRPVIKPVELLAAVGAIGGAVAIGYWWRRKRQEAAFHKKTRAALETTVEGDAQMTARPNDRDSGMTVDGGGRPGSFKPERSGAPFAAYWQGAAFLGA